MEPFCYAVATLVLAVLQVQGEVYKGLMGTYGNYDLITIDTRRNPIFSPAQDEAVPLVGSYYVRLNETTQNNITFKLCEENGAMEDNDFDLMKDPGNFHAISFGLYEWSHNFAFATGNDQYVYQYVLLVDDGSGIYGISGHFYWVNETATATTKVTMVAGTATVTATADTSTSTISNPPTESTTPTTPTTVSTMDATSSPSPSSPDPTLSTSLTSVVPPSPATSPTEGSSPSGLSGSSGSSGSSSAAVISPTEGPSPSGSSGPSSAAVIGGAVGGTLGGIIVALVAAMLVVLRRRRARKSHEPHNLPGDFHGKPELDNIPSPRAELDSPRPPKELDTLNAPTELPSPQLDSGTKSAISGRGNSARGKVASPTLDSVAGLGHDHSGITPRPERSSSDEGPYELPGFGLN